MTLYLGAGGGGDTNSAVFRALADVNAGQNAGLKYVLGAGYTKQAYYDQLKKNAPSVFESEESLNTYFDSVATKISFTEPVTEIYKLEGNITPKRDEFINAMPIDFKGGYKSWTYNTLFDESQLLINIKDSLEKAEILNNIYMAYSVKSFEKEDVRKFYNGLREFIKAKTIQKIYLMDFGADIFDFKDLARDTAMLLAIVRLLQKELPNIQLIIEVYGPGVDAHDTYTKIMENLNNVRPIKDILNKDALDKYMELLNEKRESNINGKVVKLEIMEAGRATGNYYEAWRLCKSKLQQGGKNKKKLKGGYNDYVTNFIGKRYDLTTIGEGKIKEIMDISDTTDICNFAEAYVYNISTPEKLNEFVEYLNTLPVAKDSLVILEKTLTQTAGGKPKDLKKTSEKVKVGKRDAVVYATPRGAKYVVIKGSYIKVKDIAKTLKQSTKK
jgi:hypothetical protein